MMRRSAFAGLAAGLASAVFVTNCAVPGLPPSVDRFHLVGAHRDAACGSCHVDGLERGLPNTCSGCHEEQRPTGHFDGDCGTCHVPTTWSDASIDHESFLTLTGGHEGLACGDCHLPDTYTGLDATCASCHEIDRPTGHFSGPCETCHRVTRWSDADFDHEAFFHLPHEGVRQCDQCHLQDDGYQTFSCIDCHTHGEARTAAEHREVARYVWESEACLSCHPNGREDGGS